MDNLLELVAVAGVRAGRRLCVDGLIQEAVSKLLTLRSVKEVIGEIARNRDAGNMENTSVRDTEGFLKRIGLYSRLDELSVIHMTGSKGKGSTCAMCESILRHHGYRTGFLSSPHLVNMQERIRIDGRPLDAGKFAKYAQQVYELLLKTQENGSDNMPVFASFMTILAFHVFLEEKVDVAIVEVSIGGINDYTNVFRTVAVVGITVLELEHTRLLGNTLQEIATAKAGIMKAGCQVYSVPQPAEAMDVFTAHAKQLDCPLTVVPPLSQLKFPDESSPRLPADIATYRMNASLAVQLAHAWLRIAQGSATPSLVYEVPAPTAKGLRQFQWPGRYHVVDQPYATFYMDGAHTTESMKSCAQWFMDYSDSTRDKILVYTRTPEKRVDNEFQCLVKIPFKEVFFVQPNMQRVTRIKEEQEEFAKMYQNYTQFWQNNQSQANIVLFECVSDVMKHLRNQNGKPSVLITGSFYLVGAILSIIDLKSIS